MLEAVRLCPAGDATAVTTAQVHQTVQRLRQAGHGRQGEADILIVMDSGYDVPRLAFVLADLPVELVGLLHPDESCLLPHRHAGPARTAHLPRCGDVIALGDNPTPPAGPLPSTYDHRHQPLQHPPGPPPDTGCTLG